MRQGVSLFFRNLFFTILQPGLVAALFPYWIAGNKITETFTRPFHILQCIGILLFAAGVYMLLNCIVRFAVEGRGTLSPADPTKKLVVSGLYRYSRNPMYVALTMILIAEAIFFQSNALLIYSVIVLILFNLFILLVEEPRLRKEFGNDYYEYCQKVGRWI